MIQKEKYQRTHQLIFLIIQYVQMSNSPQFCCNLIYIGVNLEVQGTFQPSYIIALIVAISSNFRECFIGVVKMRLMILESVATLVVYTTRYIKTSYLSEHPCLCLYFKISATNTWFVMKDRFVLIQIWPLMFCKLLLQNGFLARDCN